MATTAKAVKAAVKETLIGSSEEPAQLSAQTKARFQKFAVKDESSGELSMGPEEFTNAIAPVGEDYVSFLQLHGILRAVG
jgi:solute carrier family 25 aspartate/glutamate transporter 12/13